MIGLIEGRSFELIHRRVVKERKSDWPDRGPLLRADPTSGGEGARVIGPIEDHCFEVIHHRVVKAHR